MKKNLLFLMVLGASIVSNLNAQTSDPVEYGCGDEFVDVGGTDGAYLASSNETYIITPDNEGDAVTITFTYVDIETALEDGAQGGCWDYLTIYNGNSTDSEVLAETLCGQANGYEPGVASSLLSVGDSFTSTDATGALTITFTSDSSIQNDGWQADVSCATLAVDEVQPTKFNYYPNPTNGTLNISAKNNIDKVEVYSVSGKLVLSSQPNVKQSQLNLLNLKPGTYILRAEVDGKTTTNKILKK